MCIIHSLRIVSSCCFQVELQHPTTPCVAHRSPPTGLDQTSHAATRSLQDNVHASIHASGLCRSCRVFKPCRGRDSPWPSRLRRGGVRSGSDRRARWRGGRWSRTSPPKIGFGAPTGETAPEFVTLLAHKREKRTAVQRPDPWKLLPRHPSPPAGVGSRGSGVRLRVPPSTPMRTTTCNARPDPRLPLGRAVRGDCKAATAQLIVMEQLADR